MKTYRWKTFWDLNPCFPLFFLLLVACCSFGEDYCEADHFNATCSENHVILMQSAMYGRMQKGRCITGNYGSAVCSINVLNYLHHECSGRTRCSLFIPSPYLLQRKTCPNDLTAYLEASYKCVQVARASYKDCVSLRSLPLSGPLGYISGEELMRTTPSFGTSECPWNVTVQRGQTVAFKLFVFNPGSKPDGLSRCRDVGWIREALTTEALSWCVDEEKSSQIIYQSKTNQVMLELSINAVRHMGSFLIEYRAVGCPLFTPPPGAWLGIDDVTATVTCNFTGETWYLTCDTDNQRWVGKLNTCTASDQDFSSSRVTFDNEGFPFGIFLVVAVGVALGVFVGGILLSISALYLKRKQRRQLRSANQRAALDMTYSSYQPIKVQPHKCAASGTYYPADLCPAHKTVLCDEVGTCSIYCSTDRGKSKPSFEQVQGENLVT